MYSTETFFSSADHYHSGSCIIYIEGTKARKQHDISYNIIIVSYLGIVIEQELQRIILQYTQVLGYMNVYTCIITYRSIGLTAQNVMF